MFTLYRQILFGQIWTHFESGELKCQFLWYKNMAKISGSFCCCLPQSATHTMHYFESGKLFGNSKSHKQNITFRYKPDMAQQQHAYLIFVLFFSKCFPKQRIAGNRKGKKSPWDNSQFFRLYFFPSIIPQQLYFYAALFIFNFKTFFSSQKKLWETLRQRKMSTNRFWKFSLIFTLISLFCAAELPNFF